MNLSLHSNPTKLFISIWILSSPILSQNFFNSLQNSANYQNPFLTEKPKPNRFFQNLKKKIKSQSSSNQISMKNFPKPQISPNLTSFPKLEFPEFQMTLKPDFFKNLSPMKKSIFNILKKRKFVMQYSQIRPANLKEFLSNMFARYYIKAYIFQKNGIFL